MPMMARGGYVDVIGVPGGRNHYYELAQSVLAGDIPDSAHFTWKASEVLHLYLGHEQAEAVLAQARATMDPVLYSQEWDADWLHFSHRAYYNFDRDIHAVETALGDGVKRVYESEKKIRQKLRRVTS